MSPDEYSLYQRKKSEDFKSHLKMRDGQELKRIIDGFFHIAHYSQRHLLFAPTYRFIKYVLMLLLTCNPLTHGQIHEEK